MTTPNPTPTTREREAAREVAWKRAQLPDEYGKVFWTEDKRDDYFSFNDVKEEVEIIAAALARERREALALAAELALNERVDWEATNDHGDEIYNRACMDCAAAIRAEMDKP